VQHIRLADGGTWHRLQQPDLTICLLDLAVIGQLVRAFEPLRR
jgi:hypothetical protein